MGTTIRVRDLFFNTPARMKFLKKDASEGTFVADVVTRQALSHPEISFKFVREGKTQYVTPGDGQLRSAAYAVLGREFSRDLLEVASREGLYAVHGLITPPRSCRASRSMQYFYINGRAVNNRTMMAGMETAFKGTTMQGKFPGGILMLEMPAELVDVNVHPAKTEVRFARENDVFDAVYHAVKQALAAPGSGEQRFTFGKKPETPRETFQPADLGDVLENGDDSHENHVKENNFTGLSAVIRGQSEPGALPDVPQAASADSWGVPLREGLSLHSRPEAPRPDEPEQKPERPAPSFRPAERESRLDITPADEDEYLTPLPGDGDAPPPSAAWELPPEPAGPNDAGADAPSVHADAEQTVLPGMEQADRLRYVGEAFQTYIIAQRGDELYLIDKHAAHERQIYEELAAEYGEIPCQLLITPLVVSLSAEEKDALLYNSALLENVGVVMEDFGGNSILMRTTPADVEPKDLEDLAVELADKLVHGSPDALSEHTEWVLHSVACRAAIKAGDHTSPEELMVLAEKILSGKVPPTCPHGRPCVLKLTRKELEKQFGRIE